MLAKVTCDRCGEGIPIVDRTLLHVMMGPLRRRHRAIDLCPDCSWELAEFVESAPDREPAPSLAGS